MDIKQIHSCRICNQNLSSVLNVGEIPVANALKRSRADALYAPRYPLEFKMCMNCLLGQISVALPAAELFSDDYVYFTPENIESLTRHYFHVLRKMQEMGVLHTDERKTPSFVVEMGSNNGQFLKAAKHWKIEALGVDPARAAAERAAQHGIDTLVEFFGTDVAKRIARRRKADLIVARHCLAHLDNIHEIVDGFSKLLDVNGILYIENAYLVDTIQKLEFDQLYHEHMSYMTVSALNDLLEQHSLRILHVERSGIHGGTLCVFAGHVHSSAHQGDDTEAEFIRNEQVALAPEKLGAFGDSFQESIRKLQAEFEVLRSTGKRICMLGAAAKATTLLNACGLDDRDISVCYDSSLSKIGRFIPGTGIEIRDEDELIGDWRRDDKGTVCLLTAWNYLEDIRARYKGKLGKDFEFLVPVRGVSRVTLD